MLNISVGEIAVVGLAFVLFTPPSKMPTILKEAKKKLRQFYIALGLNPGEQRENNKTEALLEADEMRNFIKATKSKTSKRAKARHKSNPSES